MDSEAVNMNRKVYIRPMVLSHQPVSFETAQSYNRGRGNKYHKRRGNGGMYYPHDPRPSKK